MKPVFKSNACLCLGVLLAAAAVHALAADAPPPVQVQVTSPTRGEIHRFVTLPGTLKANQQATLYAKVPGYLKSLAVDKGDRVTAGQSLGEIEAPELAAELAQFRAELKVAEVEATRLAAAQAKAPDLVTPQALDNAQGKFLMAQANVERIETLLKYSRLTAPFAGVITARFVDPGAFIPAPTSGGGGNAAIVTLMDFNTVRAQVAVPETEAVLVHDGQPVKVSLESLPGKIFSGQVSRFSYALDETTKTMLVEADLPNPDLALRPGMYATVKVGVEKHADALLLPVEALVQEKANAFVFVNADGRAKKTAIKTGFNDGAKVEVLAGLTGNENVILVGKLAVADGAAITVTEAGK